MRAPRSARARKEAAAADAAARSRRILEEERARDAAWRRAVLQVREHCRILSLRSQCNVHTPWQNVVRLNQSALDAPQTV